jgi:hypothetical protein
MPASGLNPILLLALAAALSGGSRPPPWGQLHVKTGIPKVDRIEATR